MDEHDLTIPASEFKPGLRAHIFNGDGSHMCYVEHPPKDGGDFVMGSSEPITYRMEPIPKEIENSVAPTTDALVRALADKVGVDYEELLKLASSLSNDSKT